MSRNVRIILAIIVVIALIAVAVVAAIFVRGGDGTPSATISAPTLAIDTQAEATTAPTQAAMEGATEATPSNDTSADTASTDVESTGDVVVYNIVTDQSNVSFTLTEDLRGVPTTVVGETDQVAGQIAVDFATPQNSRVGEIRINARTLQTDNDFRNRAIRGEILQSAQDAFEFITFTPTEVVGLPETITPGQQFNFQLVGNLTIRDITQPVTFATTIVSFSETELEGYAIATVQRASFNLIIPSVPSVANVSEAVDLRIDFGAAAG